MINSFTDVTLKTEYARSRIYQNDLLKDNHLFTTIDVETPDGRYQKVETQFISETKNGDLIITPFTLNRRFWQTTQKKSKNGTYKLQTYAVTRLAQPRDGVKYLFPPNAMFPDSMPFIPPRLVEKFEQHENIKDLVITEGYLKALTASVHEDLDIIGLPSITIHKSKEADDDGRVGGLFQDILTLAAKVQNVIVLWDGDAFRFSQKDLEDERDLARRPNVFAAQVAAIKDCLKHLDCDIYFSIVRSDSLEQRPKGIDDLVLAAQKNGISKGAIKYDLTNFNGEQKYFYTTNITKKSKGIYELLGLNSVQRFYELNQDGLEKVSLFVFQKKIYTIDEHQNITEKPLYDPNDYDFYRVEIKHDRFGKEIGRNIVINSVRLLNILRKLGFRRMDIEEQTFLVRVQNNLVEEVNAKKVMDAFDAHLHKLPNVLNDGTPRELILDKIYKAESTYFGTMLYRLAPQVASGENWEFNEDTQNSSFFYYKNGYVRVTYDKVELLPYSTLTKKIWKNQILPRDFILIQEGSELSKKQFAWARFVSYIADNLENKRNPDRFGDLMRIMGYSMHRFFETKLKAIIFTDSRLEDDASGRSGKTLLCKGIGHMLNATKYAKSYVEINGKDFDEQDRFKWQELALDTKLVHLNDVKANFSVESRYNDITEGFKRQRKNEQAYSVQSKLIISSNRTVKVHGDSSKDRIVEFEMSAYFNAKWTPQQEFDQWFFRDWTEEEWQLFDNMMLKCVQLYLRKGLPVPIPINLEKRKLREETSKDFVEFMSEIVENGKRIYKKELWRLFKEAYPDWEKLTSNRFSIWLKRYTEFADYNIEEKRDREKKDEALTFKLKGS